jgi:deoxyribodipyrimidine photo-lyase
MTYQEYIDYTFNVIQESRISFLNQKPRLRGDYVLYWMQSAQRSEGNHALEYAIRMANEIHLPVVVYFGLTDQYPEANLRHYYFMLQGLREVQNSLKNRKISLVIRHESPEEGAVKLSRKAALVICDCGYLKLQKQWRQYLSEKAICPVIEIESDCIVPVRTASTKEEYSAATIRAKIISQLKQYLIPLKQTNPKISSIGFDIDRLDITDPGKALSRLSIDKSVTPVDGSKGGLSEARKRLQLFIEEGLNKYAEKRNDPNAGILSGMSPYLHFGQISPLEIALEIYKAGGPARNVYLEELIVRRELAINFVFYNLNYDSFEGLPEWSKNVLRKHVTDTRQYVYAREDLEKARTHDKYWNASQLEMMLTGKMHGYMRMYWGKKIIEWSNSPEEAFSTALYLNNKYELDGRDPNSYAGVAWCFGKHDRPWAAKPIFGNIRYMNENGLRRKFDADRYVSRINILKH